MTTLLLVIELFVTLALIGIVLIQRSEGGGLGIGGSQGMGSFMTGRGTANLLTRTTAILAAIFMALALVLALLGPGGAGGTSSILNVPALPTHTPGSSHAAQTSHPSPASAPLPATQAPLTPVPGAPTPTPAPAPAKPLLPVAPAVPAGPQVPTH